MIQGFKNFLLRGDVVVLAIGFVVALAFSTLTKAFTSDIITPIVTGQRSKAGIRSGLGDTTLKEKGYAGDVPENLFNLISNIIYISASFHVSCLRRALTPRRFVTEEQPLDDPPGSASVAAVFVAQSRTGGTEAAAERGQLRAGGREGIAGPVAYQPQSVAGPFAEAVRLDEHSPVGLREGAGSGQGLEAGHGAGFAHTVLELEELRCPLDVRQGPGPELEVELGVVSRRHPLALDPGLGATDLSDFCGSERSVPHECSGQAREPEAQVRVTCDGPAPQQRLAFPYSSPPLVVGGIGLEASGLGAVATFGSQGGVNPVQTGGGSRATENANDERRCAGEPRRARFGPAQAGAEPP